MVTIGRYQNQEDAQIEADRLRSLGIETHIIQGGASGWMPYLDSIVELQVHPGELEKLRENKEEVLENRPHRCPQCRSANYANYTSFGDHFRAIANVLTGAITRGRGVRTGGESFGFRCRDCRAKFRVDATP